MEKQKKEIKQCVECKYFDICQVNGVYVDDKVCKNFEELEVKPKNEKENEGRKNR